MGPIVVREFEALELPDQELHLAVGMFDGVHLGHQALIRGLVARARLLRAQAALVTFHPHPSEVLRSTDSAGPKGLTVPRYLTTPAERSSILEELPRGKTRFSFGKVPAP